MSEILIVTSTRKSADMLVGLFQECGHMSSRIQIAASGSEARRALLEHDFELVLVNSPLPDEFGHEFSSYASQSGNCAVIMLVKSDLFDSAAERLEPEGIFILSKPVSRPLFNQTVRAAMVSLRRIISLQEENQKLKQKLNDLRIISRAKCLLVEHKHMTEAEAHSYIEKAAMNHRKSRRDVAEIIIQSFE